LRIRSWIPAEEMKLELAAVITPEDVLCLKSVTKDYLCKPEDNVYEIDFRRFKIRDIETDTTLFEVAKPLVYPKQTSEETNANMNAARFVRYQFTPQFLKLNIVGATVEFTVGSSPVESLRMIERHFFRNTLLKHLILNSVIVFLSARIHVSTFMNFQYCRKIQLKK